MKRNLKWFLWAFVVPMVVLVGAEMALIPSSLPLWRRLLTLEDTCAYGLCFILPALLFLCALGLRPLWDAWLRAKEQEAN